MIFNINKIILWLKSGEPRILEFKKNKINIITGNSRTGKTAILHIIDYCFCSSKNKISYEHIGENVLWYGVNFDINDKHYTIARGSFDEEKHLSKDYYFSDVGNIPDIPDSKIDEDELKSIIKHEFSIDSSLTFDFGSNTIKANTKISFRYFLMFNILSGDVIENSTHYFDTRNNDRYRDALHRIFDLAIGVTTIENIVLKDKIEQCEQKIKKLEKEKEKVENQKKDEQAKIAGLIKQAKEYRLIEADSDNFENDFANLNKLIEDGIISLATLSNNDDIENFKRQRQELAIDINRLQNLIKNFSKYKEYLKRDRDSLQPILYINQFFKERIKNAEYTQFLDNLEVQFKKIKQAIHSKRPFEFDVEKLINEKKEELKQIDTILETQPQMSDRIFSDGERYLKLGEIKTKLEDILNNRNIDLNYEYNYKQITDEMKKYNAKYIPIDERREYSISMLNECIQTYLQLAKEALDEYAEYLAAFDYKQKVLNLRRSKTSNVANVSSSSDHMFMHLCLFLGMHEMIMMNDVKCVPPFLIIDQPSRPYFNNNTYDYKKSESSLAKRSDWTKVLQIFRLLNNFMVNYNSNVKNSGKEFQMILFEHVSPDAWRDCEYVNLVEEFDGDINALIKPT